MCAARLSLDSVVGRTDRSNLKFQNIKNSCDSVNSSSDLLYAALSCVRALPVTNILSCCTTVVRNYEFII
jgi:hypothetical protein